MADLASALGGTKHDEDETVTAEETARSKAIHAIHMGLDEDFIREMRDALAISISQMANLDFGSGRHNLVQIYSIWDDAVKEQPSDG